MSKDAIDLKMGKYIIDQMIFAVVGVGIIMYTPQMCSPIFTIWVEILVALSWGYLCRRLLLLPFDLIIGRKTKIVYFSRQTQTFLDYYEFFRGKYYCYWRFYYNKNSMMELLVPIAATKEEILAMKLPLVNRKVEINYYQFSKILCAWKEI